MEQKIVTSPTEQKLIGLLGKGYTQAEAAQATGVTDGFVSQLLSEDWFAEEVQKLRFAALAKHRNLDEQYDDFEEVLLGKLKKMSSLLVKPMEIASVLNTINKATRKSHGSSGPSTLTQNIVNLTIPVALANKFVTNANNQVVEVTDGDGRSQALVTIASGQLEGLSREAGAAREVARLDCIDGTFANAASPSSELQQTINAADFNRLVQGELASQGLKESLRSTRQVTAEDL